jgi:hypothetical protein
MRVTGSRIYRRSGEATGSAFASETMRGSPRRGSLPVSQNGQQLLSGSTETSEGFWRWLRSHSTRESMTNATVRCRHVSSTTFVFSINSLRIIGIHSPRRFSLSMKFLEGVCASVTSMNSNERDRRSMPTKSIDHCSQGGTANCGMTAMCVFPLSV